MKTALASSQTAAEWLGLGRAAGLWGVHPITLGRWADQGQIAVMLTAGGHRRFALADLEHFAAERKQQRLTAGLEQSWAEQALQHTRREIGGHSDQTWLAAYGEGPRPQKPELGRPRMGGRRQYASPSAGG